ncbi:hypothetical protein L204_105441 [Cryptococcus depauperatus]|nr:hypothetical protein L204_02791 [Cryptococcus depauperatus CBS 7855]
MFSRSFAFASRSIRPITQRSLSTSSGPTASSPWWSSQAAGAAVAFTALSVASLSIMSEKRKFEDPTISPQESSIAQKSLKVPIHAREVREDKPEEPVAERERVVAALSSPDVDDAADDAAKVLEEKQTEAAEPSAGAYNPETGEINWDCPCLGGMATGPCGEQFKAAFSCFVFSEAEPKGVDCVEKFKMMQDCFRDHPDIYGEEIADNEEDSSSTPQELQVSESRSEPQLKMAKDEPVTPAVSP